MVVRYKLSIITILFLVLTNAFAQIVIPDFVKRGNIPEADYQSFMNDLRMAVALKTAMPVTVGEFVSPGMIASLDPKYTRIIASNEGAEFAVSGEIRQVFGDPYSISILIASAKSDRNSDLISRQFHTESLSLLVTELAQIIADFVDPVNSLLSGDAGLFVSSEPAGATIYIDGIRVGKSPLEDVLMLEPKTHTIELRKQGFLAVKKQVNLKKGITDLQTIQLTPINGGTVQVDSFPSASIIFDGRTLDNTPLSFQALPGEHTLELIRLGFEFVALSVKVREFRVTIAEQKLKPLNSHMLFWDQPEGQLVFLDNKLEIKGYVLEPKAGLHKVTLKNGEEKIQFEINVPAEGVFYIDFNNKTLKSFD